MNDFKPILSGYLMPWLETICMLLFYHLHFIWFFIRLFQISGAFVKSPFSPAVWRFCVMIGEWIRCWLFISGFNPLQYCRRVLWPWLSEGFFQGGGNSGFFQI